MIAVFILQGTAATVLAGLYGALKVQGMPPEELRNRRIMIVGAGSAASGVALTIRYPYRYRIFLIGRRLPSPPPLRVAETGKNHWNEEIIPLLPTGIGERFGQIIP